MDLKKPNPSNTHSDDPIWERVKACTHLFKPAEFKDSIYEMLKEMILRLELKGGDRVPVEAIAKEIGTSRTPVREALLRLENEGLVRAVSRVGFFVESFSKRDLRDLFELREMTEGYAAEKAAEMMTDEDIRTMEDLQAHSQQAVSAEDWNLWLKLEIKLHALIMERSGNRQLPKMVEGIKELTERERLIGVHSIDNVKKALEEHAVIIVALKSRDRRGAGAAMRAHLGAIKNRLLSSLDLPDDLPD